MMEAAAIWNIEKLMLILNRLTDSTNFDSEVDPVTYHRTVLTNMTFEKKPRWR